MSDPFRDDPHGHSPTLERLATRSPAAGEIVEIERVPAEDRELVLGNALGDTTPIGCLAAVGYVAAVAVGIAWLTGAVAAPDAEITQIDDHTFRVVLRGTAPTDASQPPAAPADDSELRRFVDDVLVSVHADVGIASVTLGGTAKALAPPKKS